MTGSTLNEIDDIEIATLKDVIWLVDAFEYECPTPCHRDYCAANWLVDEKAWSGVIDFEFAYWDVRVADFT